MVGRSLSLACRTAAEIVAIDSSIRSVQESLVFNLAQACHRKGNTSAQVAADQFLHRAVPLLTSARVLLGSLKHLGGCEGLLDLGTVDVDECLEETLFDVKALCMEKQGVVSEVIKLSTEATQDDTAPSHSINSVPALVTFTLVEVLKNSFGNDDSPLLHAIAPVHALQTYLWAAACFEHHNIDVDLDGPVTIRTSASDSAVGLCISDSGIHC